MPQAPIQQADDFAVVDRVTNTNIFVSIPARYVLTNRSDARGNRRQFACRVVNISPHAMTLAAPVNGAIRERVITYSNEFGKLEGVITRLLNRGFIMTIASTDEGRTRLTDKIDQYEQIKNHDLFDRRKHKRIIPKNPHSTLTLADGSVLGCFIIDMSVSGIAVSADIELKIGTSLAVGELVGRVIRHFADGFAVRFIKLQDLGRLEKRLIPP